LVVLMKSVCVPKDQDALIRLDYNENKPGDLLEVILDDQDFEKLWQSGFFNSINVLAHSMIDIFENENISESKKLESVINSDLFQNSKYDENIFKIVRKIEELFKEALHRNTGIHFYF